MSPSSSESDSTDVAIGTHESMATSETDGDAFSGRLLQSIHLYTSKTVVPSLLAFASR